MNSAQTIILGVVEGLTEFLPISSTGHMVIASHFMGIQEDPFVKAFEVIIQAGAILSVLLLYWKRFLPNLEFYKKLFIAFIPAAIFGLLLKKKIEILLGSVEVVAWALIAGGVLLVWSDRWFQEAKLKKHCKDLSLPDALRIGFFQCFAFIPGVSRSAATILGGLGHGLTRKEAAEFSFFLAVPTLLGATVVKLKDIIGAPLPEGGIGLLVLGAGVSFIVAALAIRFFISIVSKFGFRFFGIYRILLGLVILILIYSGQNLQY